MGCSAEVGSARAHGVGPRLGGVAIFGSFAAVAALAVLLQKVTGVPLVLPARTAFCIFGSALTIFLLGLYDDVRYVGPYWKFGIQTLAAVLLYIGGVGVHRIDLVSSGRTLGTVPGLPLTVFWVLLITNAFNLIDGLDGLAAGSAFFSTIVLLASSLFTPSAMVTLLAIALAERYSASCASIFIPRLFSWATRAACL